MVESFLVLDSKQLHVCGMDKIGSKRLSQHKNRSEFSSPIYLRIECLSWDVFGPITHTN